MSQVLNEFVSLESFGFMHDGSLLGYRLEDIEPELRCLIPRLDPSYVFEKDALSIMSAWFEIGSGEPLFISGPHGSGKTSFVNQYCARVNAPVISITARARLDRTDLIGGYVIDKDKSMTVRSRGLGGTAVCFLLMRCRQRRRIFGCRSMNSWKVLRFISRRPEK